RSPPTSLPTVRTPTTPCGKAFLPQTSALTAGSETFSPVATHTHPALFLLLTGRRIRPNPHPPLPTPVLPKSLLPQMSKTTLKLAMRLWQLTTLPPLTSPTSLMPSPSRLMQSNVHRYGYLTLAPPITSQLTFLTS